MEITEATNGKGKDGLWLLDSCDTGYWIPADNGVLRIVRAKRSLPYYSHWRIDDAKLDPSLLPLNDEKKENEGDMELAWLDHGTAPASASYEYAVLIDTNSEKIAKFAEEMKRRRTADESAIDNPPYRILQKDTKAHIVWHRSSDSTGYGIFDEEWSPVVSHQSSADQIQELKTNDQRPKTENCVLLSVSHPCIVMTRPAGEGRMRVSLANPDWGIDPNVPPDTGLRPDMPFLHNRLDLVKVYPEIRTHAVFRGNWDVRGEDVSRLDGGPAGTTSVEFRCVAGLPVQAEFMDISLNGK